MNWRCWLGHDWPKDAWTQGEPFVCASCGAESSKCRNCGRFHDPTAIVICTVTR